MNISRRVAVTFASAMLSTALLASNASGQASQADRTAPWKGEWHTDRMTDRKTYRISTRVETAKGFFDLTVRCERGNFWQLYFVITAYTNDGKAREILSSPRRHVIQIRLDRHPVIEQGFVAPDFSNRIEGHFDGSSPRETSRSVKEQRFLASKSVLIGDIFPNEITEVTTNFSSELVSECRRGANIAAFPPPTRELEFLMEFRKAVAAGEDMAEFMKRPAFTQLLEKAVRGSISELQDLVTIPQQAELIDGRFLWLTSCVARLCYLVGAAIVVDTEAGGVYIVAFPLNPKGQRTVEHVLEPNPAAAPAVRQRIKMWRAEYGAP